MIQSAAALLQVMRNFRTPLPVLSKRVERRLFRILVTAYRHVPYYRETMRAAGYDPEHEYQGPQDLLRLPVLTKRIIKDWGEEAFVDERVDLSKCLLERTSGSTGIPVQIRRNSYSQSMIQAKYFRTYLVNGYRFTDKVLGLRPQKTAIIEEGGPLRHLGLLRWRKIDHKMSPQAVVDHLLAFKPDFLYGNLVLFEMIAQELGRRGTSFDKMKGVLPGGEVVTDLHRQRLEEVFQAPVIVTYGSIEMGTMAFDTPDRPGLCLCEDLVHFEFLTEDGKTASPGQRCRIIATDLTNETMPFIRYDHEDWVTLEPDSDGTGLGWRRLRAVEGRINETFRFSDGSVFTFLIPAGIVKMYPAIRQFRIVQKKQDLLHILVAGDRDYLDSVRELILADFRKQVSEVVDLVLVPVESLPPDANGKLRILVSEVES